MKRQAFPVGLSVSLVGCVLLLTLTLLERQTQAQGGSTIHVAPGGDCGEATPCYAHPQDAVDAAIHGDVIKVAAGTYTGVSARQGVTQVVFISKSVTIRAGYTITDWNSFDPDAHLTILDAQGQGRVAYITGDISPTIEGLRITGGTAHGLGGGPLWGDAGGGAYTINATVTLRHNQLLNNAADYGGGLYLDHSAATLDRNTASLNTAGGHGGGLYLDHSVAALSGNTFSSNTAGRDGGAMYLSRSDAALSGDSVSSNTADGYGGGMHLWLSDATLSGSTVVANSAFCGGGIYVCRSAAALSGSTVTSNTASFRGGGLYVHVQGEATLSSNTLSSNTADYGGGMYLYQSTATLTGNTVSSNIANDGTGVYLYQSDAGLTNNLVVDNQSRGIGAGLYSKGSSSRLLQNTIARNGSGVYVTNASNYSSVVLTNTILVSHSVGITVTRGNTATLEATLWGLNDWANVTDWRGAGTIITGTRNAWGNPSFLDPEAGDYHIGPGSAAIDAGVDAGVTTDIDDDPRPVGDGFDIGADEYFPRVGVAYLPVTLRSHSP